MSELTLSPSKLEAFDPTTPFGCERRWWFEHAEAGPKIKPPQAEHFIIGEEFHKEVEHYLINKKPVEHPSRLFKAVEHIVRDVLSEGIGPVEQWIKFSLAGVPFRGRIDLILGGRRGVLDWKTTSSISKYAKSPSDLRSNHQMVLYAYYLLEAGLVDAPVTLEHVYAQTKGACLGTRVSATISAKQIAEHVDNKVLPLVARIKDANTEPDVQKLKAEPSKCNRCPHLPICPKGNSNVSTFLERFKQLSTPTAPILPPDAPKSNPALAADPVPGFTLAVAPPATVPVTEFKKKLTFKDEPAPDAVATAPERPVAASAPAPEPLPPPAEEPRKRGPGRPRKEAPAISPSAKHEVIAVDLSGVKLESNSKPHFEVTSVKYAQGVTINLGDFQSARIDIGLEARCSLGSASEALAELKKRVNDELLEASKAFSPAKK